MSEPRMATSLRTHTCGQLSRDDVGSTVHLCGWVDRRRDQGGIQFVDLRDRYGRTQLVFNRSLGVDVFSRAERLHLEDVIRIRGEVVAREEENVNPALGTTGTIEVLVEELTVLTNAETPLPFEVSTAAEKDEEVGLEIRLRHRHLDLRRPHSQERLIFRHRVIHAMRTYLDEQEFVEIETPILTKSTPEGARDYIVPSRVHSHSFYALPQSPQLFKQLLMVSGFDRYYQLARCFRDEDLRADRQPEFTQIDLEMSYIGEEDLFRLVEGMMAEMMNAVGKGPVETPFPRITYAEAMARYGTDKPDIRFGMEIVDISDLAQRTDFRIFHGALEKKTGCVRALPVKQGGDRLSRKQIDGLESVWRETGAKGLAWCKRTDSGMSGPASRFFPDDLGEELCERLQLEEGDLALFCADVRSVVEETLGTLRLHLGDELELIPEEEFAYCWIVEWPLFEDDGEGGIRASHHPFTSPREADLSLLEERPTEVMSRAYDLVLNGLELGSGSIRIHRRDVQNRIFRLLGIGEEEAEEKFGFLLRAFETGAPPHGGIAFGIDRLVRLLIGVDNIREVIAFPKTLAATCLLTEAPGPVAEKQLNDLHLDLRETD